MTAPAVLGSWTVGVWGEVLPNGLTVLVQRDPTAPAVAIVTHVAAGFFDEPDEWVGISHVLEHMFFKGTPTRGVGAIARETKAAGGYLNAGTSYDFTVYYTVLPSRALGTGLAIQADALQHPLLDPGELERELKVIIEEAKRKLDTPGAVARERLHEVMYDQHRIRRWRIGRADALARLTRDDLRRYYQTRYLPTRTILAIVGDIDEAETLQLVRRHYGAWERAAPALESSPDEPEHPGLRVRTLRGDIALAHVACGWPTVPPLHPDAPALDLAAGILGLGRGSWLYRRLREPGLASSVAASHFAPTELGMMTVTAELRPERLDDVLAQVANAVRQLIEDGPPEDDLERVRRLLVMQWARGLEPTEGRASAFAAAQALRDIHFLDDQFARLMAITAEEVRAVAARYLSPETLSILAYLPRAAGRELAREAVERTFSAAAATALTPPATPAIVFAGRRPAPSRTEHTVHRSELPGVDLLVRRKPGVPAVTVGVYGSRASFDPAGQAGLGALAIRSAVRGAGGLDASSLAFAFERLGGAIAPRIANDWAGFETAIVADQLGPAVQLLRQVVEAPGYHSLDVERERSILTAEAKRVIDDMVRFPFRLAFGAAYGDRGYGLPVSGLPETLEALSVDDVVRWHGAWLDATRLSVAVVGDVEPAEATEILAGAFHSWPERAGVVQPLETPWVASGQTRRREERPKAQSALAFAFPGLRRADPRRFAAEVWAAAAGGLGGRLFEALREQRALAYTVLATPWMRRGTGALVTYIATSPGREEEAYGAMLAELAQYREAPLPEADLERAVNYLAGQAEVRRQVGASLLAEIREAWLTGAGLVEIEDPAAPYRAVTAEAVHQLTRECLDPGRMAVGLVHGTGAAGEP